MKFRSAFNRKSKIENLKWLGLSVIAFVLVVNGALALAQQPAKVYRIGYLRSEKAPEIDIEGFRQGLREHGYVEGRNMVVEYRSADGKEERLRPL
jgi:hypothetical protein